MRRARRQEGEDQTILVSGESGAGKTESTRRVLEYLVKTSSRLASSHGGAAAAAGHLQNKLLQSNPLLETLGNAKTMRNDNSSRFGKFIQVYFDANCAIAGGTVRTRPAAHDPPAHDQLQTTPAPIAAPMAAPARKDAAPVNPRPHRQPSPTLAPHRPPLPLASAGAHLPAREEPRGGAGQGGA